MHITHVVAHPPFREGTGTACYYNALALQKLGCRVKICAPHLGRPDTRTFQVPYHFMRSYLSIGNAYLTPDILSIDKTDIIHLHYPFIFGSGLAILRSRLKHIPLVLTYHSDLCGSGIRRLAFWFYNRFNAPWILNRASKIIVTSFDYAVSSFFGGTIFKRRWSDLVEVGNGVDVEFFRPGIEAGFIRQRHRLAECDVVLLFVSSLDRSHARKGLYLLLEALAEVPEGVVKLIIIGDGDMRPEYEKHIRTLGLGHRVIFAGRISQDELPAYYVACDAVCIPSYPPEAFGMALAQGMASGKPVIGSEIPGVRRLIGLESGFLIPPGNKEALVDCIQMLAMDSRMRIRMGLAGRERIVRDFTWREVGKKILSVYRQVLSE